MLINVSIRIVCSEDAFQKITPSTDIGGSSNGVIMEKQKKKTTGNVTNSLSKALKSTSLNNNAHDGDNRAADTCRADQNGIQRTLEKVCVYYYYYHTCLLTQSP